MHASVWLLLLSFTIAKTWKQSKCPSTDEWIKKVWWIYTWWNTSQSVQSLSYVWFFATPWITARQASLSITNSRSLLKLMSIESVMPSNHLILCLPFLLLPPIPPSIKVFSNESTLHMRQKGGNLPFATTWMELESIMISEMSEKDKSYMIPLMWHLKNTAR